MTSPQKKELAISVRTRTDSEDSSTPSVKAQRVARFAEATAVHSPIEPSYSNQPPFTPLPASTHHYKPQPQPADVGFGYIGDRTATQGCSNMLGVEMPLSPQTPLKSAMKTPGAGPRTGGDNPLSPTFKEEQVLELREMSTEKEQAKDLKVKVRVRLAKMVLRSTNFACSLIVLGMLASTFSIFNATRHLPPRNSLPPWAQGTNPWAQYVLLGIACLSLFMSIVIFYGYWRGGQRRADKAATYYTIFSVAFFTFSIVMWGVGAGILHSSKQNGNGKDLWGWSCKNNTRKLLFDQDVSYDLICRLQNWSLVCCLIEVVVETITIMIYGIMFHRYYTKHKLRKSMQQRDEARSQLYLAHLRSQSAPNTGIPMSARDGGWNPQYSSRFAPGTQQDDQVVAAEEGNGGNVRYIPVQLPAPKPFVLQAPPLRGTPKPLQMKTFDSPTSSPSEATASPMQGQPQNMAVPPSIAEPPMTPLYRPPVVDVYAAPGEQVYDTVPIPGAYSSTVPTLNAVQPQHGYLGNSR